MSGSVAVRATRAHSAALIRQALERDFPGIILAGSLGCMLAPCASLSLINSSGNQRHIVLSAAPTPWLHSASAASTRTSRIRRRRDNKPAFAERSGQEPKANRSLEFKRHIDRPT